MNGSRLWSFSFPRNIARELSLNSKPEHVFITIKHIRSHSSPHLTSKIKKNMGVVSSLLSARGRCSALFPAPQTAAYLCGLSSEHPSEYSEWILGSSGPNRRSGVARGVRQLRHRMWSGTERLRDPEWPWSWNRSGVPGAPNKFSRGHGRPTVSMSRPRRS